MRGCALVDFRGGSPSSDLASPRPPLPLWRRDAPLSASLTSRLVILDHDSHPAGLRRCGKQLFARLAFDNHVAANSADRQRADIACSPASLSLIRANPIPSGPRARQHPSPVSHLARANSMPSGPPARQHPLPVSHLARANSMPSGPPARQHPLPVSHLDGAISMPSGRRAHRHPSPASRSERAAAAPSGPRAGRVRQRRPSKIQLFDPGLHARRRHAASQKSTHEPSRYRNRPAAGRARGGSPRIAFAVSRSAPPKFFTVETTSASPSRRALRAQSRSGFDSVPAASYSAAAVLIAAPVLSITSARRAVVPRRACPIGRLVRRFSLGAGGRRSRACPRAGGRGLPHAENRRGATPRPAPAPSRPRPRLGPRA